MPTQYSAKRLGFVPVEKRSVVASFDGGAITSDAGALLLGATHRAIGLVDRFAVCFTDSRKAQRVEHLPATIIGQRVFGIALGYEDLPACSQNRNRLVSARTDGRACKPRGKCDIMISILEVFDGPARGSQSG